MEFWKTIFALVKRAYISVPVILLTVTIGIMTAYFVPPRYEVNALLVLTAPTSGGTIAFDPRDQPGLTNPLLLFNDGLRTTASVLTMAMNTNDARRSVGVAPQGPTELIVDDGRSDPDLLGAPGPFIHIEAESPSAEDAHDVVVRTEARLRRDLQLRQESLGVPPSTFITMVRVIAPSSATPVMKYTVQAGGAGFVLSLGVATVIAYAADRIRWRRSERRAGRPPAAPSVLESQERSHQTPLMPASTAR